MQQRMTRDLLFPALCFGLLTVAASAGAQTDRNDDNNGLPSWAHHELAAERAVQARYEADLLARPGVVGMGIGLTNEGGKERPGLVVLVDESARAQLDDLPARLDSVPVRVEVVAGGGIVNGGSGCSGGSTGQGVMRRMNSARARAQGTEAGQPPDRQRRMAQSMGWD